MNALARSLLIALCSAFVGLVLGYVVADRGCAQQRAKAVEKVAEKTSEAVGVTAEVQVAAAEKVVEIKTVFKERVVYRDREVPVEVRVREDAQCVVPDRFVRMWNSANRGELPDAPSEPDARSDRVEVATARGRGEALGYRGAARERSRGDAPEYGAAEGIDHLDPETAGDLR